MEGMGSSDPKRPFSLMASSSSKSPLRLSANSPFLLLPKHYSLNPSQQAHSMPAGFAHNNNAALHANLAFNAAIPNNAASVPQNNQQQQTQQAPLKVAPNSDRKLKRVESNRVSAQRSRVRKLQRMANLERQSSMLESQIALLRPKVAAYTEKKQLLIIEQVALTQKLAALDKEKIVKEAEIVRNQAEVQMLRELEKKQKEDFLKAQAMSYINWDAVWHDNNQFGPQEMVYTSPPQGFENEEGTSEMEVDEQNLNFNYIDPMSELDAAVVNTSMLSNEESNLEFRHGF